MKQYQFSLKDECMKELPEYGRRNYQQKAKQPLSIPVPKEYLNQFEDGEVYNEDGFEISKIHERKIIDGRYVYDIEKCAIPKQKVDDTELLKNIFLDHSFTHWDGAEHSQAVDVDEWDNVIKEIQKHYIITKK